MSLLTSELVTNSLLHARTDTHVVVSAYDGRLRIEVHDGSLVGPSRNRYSADAATGRGMLLIEALAAEWGCELYRAGKSVWYELELPDQTVTTVGSPDRSSSR